MYVCVFVCVCVCVCVIDLFIFADVLQLSNVYKGSSAAKLYKQAVISDLRYTEIRLSTERWTFYPIAIY